MNTPTKISLTADQLHAYEEAMQLVSDDSATRESLNLALNTLAAAGLSASFLYRKIQKRLVGTEEMLPLDLLMLDRRKPR